MGFNGIRRRELLATAGLATAGIAGCGGNQSSGDTEAAEDDETDVTETETETETQTETETDPLRIDGLQLSLTPDTIEASDGSVTAWRDDSGNGNDFTQDTAEARPSVAPSAANGNAALQFDGEDDFLLREDALGIPNDSARTFVVVCRLSDPAARSPYLMQGQFGSSGGDSNYYGLEANTWQSSPEQFGLYLISVGQEAERETNTAYNVHVIRTESFPELSSIEESTTYYINGQQVAFSSTSGNARNSPFEADSTAIGTFPQPSPGSLMHGEIAEVAVYDRALNDAERSSIEEKMLEKYGISGAN